LNDGQRYIVRRLLEYGHREEGYYVEFNPDGTYTTPSAGQLDLVFENVDELEDELMTDHADVNLYGWDGALWRKLPLLFGFSANWDESLNETSTSSPWYKYLSVVPAGEVRILQALSLANQTRATTNVFLQVNRMSGGQLCVGFSAALPQYAPLLFTGAVLLAAGDRIFLYMGGSQIGDSITGCVSGYKMKITE
jgi:hypothetical protein